MPLTPDEIKNKVFRTGIRGYNAVEVDTFLDEVEAEFSRLLADNEELRKRLDAALATPPPAPVSEGDEMIRRTLLLAQRTADEAVAAANAEAERILTEARTQAAAAVQQAQAQAAAAVGDLELRRSDLEQRIEGLRAFEREYRTRLRAYLETQLRDLESRAPATEAAPQAEEASVFAPVQSAASDEVPRLAP